MSYSLPSDRTTNASVIQNEEPLPLEESRMNILSICDLPNEILLQIFSYLDVRTLLMRVGLVCQLWNDLVRNDTLWRSFRQLSLEENISSQLTRLIEKCVNLCHLTLKAREYWPKKLMNSTLFNAVSHLHKLKSFSLKHFYIDSDSAGPVRHCLKCLPSLSTLDLSYCKISNEVGQSISEAVSWPESLKSLYLVGHSIENRILVKIIKNCSHLQHLDISSCYYNFDNSSIGSVLRVHSATLQSLNLRGITLSESDFGNIENCSHLSVLKVNCSTLTDQTLHRIKELPLHDLELNYGFNFTSVGLREFFEDRTISQLKCLSVHGCSMFEDSTLKTVANQCPDLLILRAGSCTKVTDEGIWHVIHNCPKLIMLVVQGLKELKGYFLKEIHHHLKFMKLLDLAYCECIDVTLLQMFTYFHPHFKTKVVAHDVLPYFGNRINSESSYVELTTIIDPNFQPLLIISKNMCEKLSSV